MPNKPVRKLVIPVAGVGTRMLPVTKAQPKEMLPVLDKPVLQYIVENAVKAGIRDIIMVTGSSKRAIEDHFDRNEYLEQLCLSSGKNEIRKQIKEIAELANFIYIRQHGPYGTATPILNAKDIVGDEPFAVVWGDEIIECPNGQTHLGQLIETYNKYGEPVITIINTDDEGTKKYGIAEGQEVETGVYKVDKLMEKPGPENTASRLGSIGGFILTPDIFPIIESMPPIEGRERYLTDAIDLLARQRPTYARLIDCEHFDSGNKFNWLKTNIEFGLRDEEIGEKLKIYLKNKNLN